jgi:hypothetical protein
MFTLFISRSYLVDDCFCHNNLSLPTSICEAAIQVIITQNYGTFCEMAWLFQTRIKLRIPFKQLQICEITSVFHKMQRTSGLAEEFITFQEGLCSMELAGKIRTSSNSVDEHRSLLGCYAVSTGRFTSGQDVTSQMT